MDRIEYLRRRLDRSMRLVEIGPSHRPLVAKRDGWRTTVVDHAPRHELLAKYGGPGLDTAAIEDVDVIWSGGDLAAKFPAEAHGCIDAIVASHSLEHFPDPITFFKSAERLLAPHGIIVLALPDKRYMFDFFEPMTTTADWLTAYGQQAVTHTRRAAFNHVAYNVTNAGRITWDYTHRLDDLQLTQSLQEGAVHFDFNTDDGQGHHYHDYHAWRFTPASFALILLEASILCDMRLVVAECTPAFEYEFFVVVARGEPMPAGDGVLNARRLDLLKASMRELRQATDLLLGVL